MRCLKFLLCVSAFLFLPGITFSQKGYLMIDSAYSTGFIENQGQRLNTKEVKFKRSISSPVTIYYPTTVTEFGFDDKIYRSRKISTGSDSAQLFLYVLAKGNNTLYSVKVNGRKRFFVENEKKFIELKKADKAYQHEINGLFEGCDDYKSYVSRLRFNKKTLRRFFALQNTCYSKGPWPIARWSAVTGYANTELFVVNAYGDKLNFGGDATPFFGIGVELPLGTRPNWFISLNILYQQNSYQKSTTEFSEFEFRTAEYDVKLSTVSLPILVKYGVAINKKAKGYLLIGPSVAYNLNRDSFMKEEIVRNSEELTNEDASDLVTPVTVSGTTGLGFEYYLNSSLSVGLEGRYSTGVGFGTEGHSISVKQIALVVNF